MVCSQNPETQALCCVKEAPFGDHSAFLFPVADTVADLFQEVGRRFNYDPETFELDIMLRIDGTLQHLVLNKMKDQSLQSVGLRAESGLRHNILLLPLKGVHMRQQRIPEVENKNTDDATNASVAAPRNNDLLGLEQLLGDHPSPLGDLAPPPEPPPPPPAVIQPSNRWPSVTQYNEVPSSSAVPYVGLVNQAMTCYLNSLLQALFMTPEFRNALYHWEYDGSHTDEAKSMPYQLQKLFLNLQTSNRASVETTALTRSFGWDSSEAWQQHDIQELCRVMFDALEQKFKDTDQADLINRLYEGTMTDYVKCLECSTEKHREDKFLDIPLPVRPFGSTVAYGSVGEALRAFVQPETLEGNNQYHCERCGKKCDAHKGLKFTKFPYLLTLHLKRFDFDYNTLNRIKLNDKVSFPEKINLNGFIPSKAEGESPIEAVEETVKCDDSSTTDSGSALDEDNTVDTPSTSNHTDYQEDDEGIDLSNTHESEKNRFNAADSGEAGPYIYELFSIMIHSGSASGGHYYAYIKDFNQGDWYCFNDQCVSRITHEDITKTYGGGRGYYSGAYSSSTNAYMLMYRQIDSARNATAMTVEEFPPHIKKLLVKIEEQKEIEYRMREREQDMVRVKCYYQPPDQPIQDFRLAVNRDASLRETTREALQCANLEVSVPLEQCRLVSYDRAKGTIECSFEGKEEESIRVLLNNEYKRELLLEVRGKDEVFAVYRPGDISTKVMVINPVTEEVEGPLVVKGNMDATVAEYRAAVAAALHTEPESTHILLEKYNSEPQLLTTEDQPLRSAGFTNNRVFALTGTITDFPRIQRIVERAKHIITLHVTLPTVTKEALDQLNITSLEDGCTSCRLDGAGGDHDRDRERDRDASPQPLPDPEDPLAGPPSDQSASEDSSLTDSERTIVGEAPDQSPTVSPSGSPVTWEHNASSPENEAVDMVPTKYNLSRVEKRVGKRRLGKLGKYYEGPGERSNDEDDDVEALYFRAAPYQEGSVSMLRVLADKRIALRQLKEYLQPHVGVCVDYFKVFRTSNGQETECTRPTETLKMSGDEVHLTVRLGRALRKGEVAGKVYLLDIKSPEPDRFLIEWVIAAGSPVSTVKSEILAEVRRKCGLDIPYDRCRLRLKKWKEPSKPYLDDSLLTDIMANWDLYLQELEGPEPITNMEQRLMFVGQWCPSSLELRPLVEIVLESNLVSELKRKISELSEIPSENLEFAKDKGYFTCGDMTLRRIHSDLEWNSTAERLDDYPLNISEHGTVIIYKDNREKLKVMSHVERKDWISQDRGKPGLRAFTQKKERALKIYVDNTPPRRRDEYDVD